MNLKFNNKRISGILTLLPEYEISFDDEIDNYNFSKEKSLKLKMAMGYKTHRIFNPEVCISDLATYAINYLFDNKLLSREEIDALILVTQSPDYFMPPTSNVIQGKLGLKNDIFCLDINQGCAGFIMGLFQCFMLLEQESVNKAILINADILSKKVSKRDRNSNPLIGDALSITIVEKEKLSDPIFANLKMDGLGYEALIIPAGGFKLPSNTETGIYRVDEAGNYRSLDNLVMKGDEVFNFVQREVPPMIDNLLLFSGVSKEEIDYFIFHQPNKFMLNKLADKIGVARERMPSNIVENFGNSSGVTIPVALTYNLGENLEKKSFKMCLAGFGVGLTWASILMNIGKLNFNRNIYFEN